MDGIVAVVARFARASVELSYLGIEEVYRLLMPQNLKRFILNQIVENQSTINIPTK